MRSSHSRAPVDIAAMDVDAEGWQRRHRSPLPVTYLDVSRAAQPSRRRSPPTSGKAMLPASLANSKTV